VHRQRHSVQRAQRTVGGRRYPRAQVSQTLTDVGDDLCPGRQRGCEPLMYAGIADDVGFVRGQLNLDINDEA
jgi:hypothetical protein